VGTGLPQQCQGLWLSLGPKREDFSGETSRFGGGRVGTCLPHPGTWSTLRTQGTRSPRAVEPHWGPRGRGTSPPPPCSLLPGTAGKGSTGLGAPCHPLPLPAGPLLQGPRGSRCHPPSRQPGGHRWGVAGGRGVRRSPQDSRADAPHRAAGDVATSPPVPGSGPRAAPQGSGVGACPGTLLRPGSPSALTSGPANEQHGGQAPGSTQRQHAAAVRLSLYSRYNRLLGAGASTGTTQRG